MHCAVTPRNSASEATTLPDAIWPSLYHDVRCKALLQTGRNRVRADTGGEKPPCTPGHHRSCIASAV